MAKNPPIPPRRVDQVEIRTIVPIYLPEGPGPEVDVFTDPDDDTWLIGPNAARHASHRTEDAYGSRCASAALELG